MDGLLGQYVESVDFDRLRDIIPDTIVPALFRRCQVLRPTGFKKSKVIESKTLAAILRRGCGSETFW